jgi:major capsid protein gp7
MALTLIEAAKLATDMLQRGVIETFASTSAVLERLPFANIEGNAYRYNVENALPGIAFRGVNEGFTESTGVVNPQVETLVIGGGDSDVDRFIVQTRSNVNDVRAVHDRLKTKALSLSITKTFFDGDSLANPKAFDGLNKRLTGGAQEIEAGANGVDLTQEMLDELIDKIDGAPDVLFASKAMRREIEKLARANQQITYGLDGFGRRVTMYAGVPIGIIETDETGAEILGFDETQGSSNVTGSIYAVRFGEEEAAWGIQNGGISVRDLGELETKPVFRTRVEWYLGLVVGHPRCVARLKGITVNS